MSDEESGAPRRMTFGLNPRADRAMAEVMAMEECNQTDAISRSLERHAWMLREIAAGREIVVRDPDTGLEKTVVFL